MVIRVYIDLVLGLNYLFDLVLLFSVNYILKRNVSRIRLMGGALIGELSILFLFINVTSIVLLLKLILSIIIIIYSFGYKDMGYFFKNIIYFYFVSILLGGGIYFLKNEFRIPYIYIIFISLFVFSKWIKYMVINRVYSSFYYRVDLYFNRDEHILLNAYLDSGNRLKDPYGNKDIIIVNKDKVVGNNRVIYVPFFSLNHTDLLCCIKGYKMVIDGKENSNFLIGISEDKIMMDGIDCVISNSILEGLR